MYVTASWIAVVASIKEELGMYKILPFFLKWKGAAECLSYSFVFGNREKMKFLEEMGSSDNYEKNNTFINITPYGSSGLNS